MVALALMKKFITASHVAQKWKLGTIEVEAFLLAEYEAFSEIVCVGNLIRISVRQCCNNFTHQASLYLLTAWIFTGMVQIVTTMSQLLSMTAIHKGFISFIVTVSAKNCHVQLMSNDRKHVIFLKGLKM
ncbi:uncharacterized protein LOC111102294 [Crassostrea virginica]